MIDLQQILNSSLSLRLVSALAQRLPPRAGYRLATLAAEQIAHRRNSRLVRALRANQWVIRGEPEDAKALDQAVLESLRHSARCLFDLYHYIDNPTAAGELIVLEPSFRRFAQRAEFEPCGLMIVGMHLSNFDLILQWICKQVLKPLALTLPDPQGGRRVEYEMRRRAGMNIIPTSVSALRKAIKHLQQGGMVVTGIDRPIPKPEVCPRFFGRPAPLPVHHIFLATKAQVPVIVAAANLEKDDKYHVFASDLIEMDPDPDPAAGLLHNAEKVLATVERFIRECPQQWSVPLPLWPQIMDLVPK